MKSKIIKRTCLSQHITTTGTTCGMQAAAWRLKTETVSRILPDALEKSMIPQLHKAARQCIQSLLQDVNALNDTTASDLFGGTPAQHEKPPGHDRMDHASHLAPSQHTVCFSSPGNLVTAVADVPQTEMLEAGTVADRSHVPPSQEEQGPSVSLRHGFALSQAHTALDKGDAEDAAKEPASPLLKGFLLLDRKEIAATGPNDGGDGCVGMTTDETHVSDDRILDGKHVPGGKRKFSDASAGDGDGPDDSDDFVKAHKPDQQNSLDEAVPQDVDTPDKGHADDRSTSALAERLKALKNQEALAC